MTPAKRAHVGSGGALRGRGTSSAGRRGFGASNAPALPQRVVVKVRIVRHRSPAKGRGSLRAHLSYLSREAVTRDPGSGRFYDAASNDLDAKVATRPWRDDRHHFRIILSPENAHQIPDLSAFTREVMRRVERDLGPLEWIAVNHRNTDNPHTHQLYRGRAHNGADLVISREYISHGIRDRAADVATEWLGERTREQAQMALATEILAERYTSLDRALARFASRSGNVLTITLQQVTLGRFALTTREMLAGRLEFLTQLGLAEHATRRPGQSRGHDRTWTLAPDFQPRLRELGERNDIVKQLYGTLGPRAARVAPQIQRLSITANEEGPPTASVRGLLIAKGAIDETGDTRFVVVEDRHGTPHYARVWSDQAIDAAEVGCVVEAGRSAHRRQALLQEVISVAHAHTDSLYSTGAHRQWLREHRSDLSAERIEHRLRNCSKVVAGLARQRNSGVTRAADNAVKLDDELLRRFTTRAARHLDVRVLAANSLATQTVAEAYTWLDRQIIRERLKGGLPDNDIARLPAVRDAMAKRADWLIMRGFAERDPEAPYGSAVRFHYGATEQLKMLEHREFANRCKQRFGKSVSFLRPRDTLKGVYCGTAYLHRGVYALVATKQQLFAAPVSREPRIDRGRSVTARVVARNHTKWDFGLDR
ncbi:MAG: DUF3363 domain-containing protein [Phycisphaerae bacterium]